MNDKRTITSIEQGRAKFAYECVEAAIDKLSEKAKNEYKSYSKNIPMLIKTNGLASAFAFIKSKKDSKSYQLIYSQTTDWLKTDRKKLIDLTPEDDLVKCLIALNSPEYRAVTIEVLAFFNWLRRFADGLIEDKKEHANESNG